MAWRAKNPCIVELLICPLPTVPGERAWSGRPLDWGVEAGGEVPVAEVGPWSGGAVGKPRAGRMLGVCRLGTLRGQLWLVAGGLVVAVLVVVAVIVGWGRGYTGLGVGLAISQPSQAALAGIHDVWRRGVQAPGAGLWTLVGLGVAAVLPTSWLWIGAAITVAAKLSTVRVCSENIVVAARLSAARLALRC